MQSHLIAVTLFVCVSAFVCHVDGSASRILGVFSTPSRQHWYVHQTLMLGLAERGHDVTVISPFEMDPSAVRLKNFKHIHVTVDKIDEYDLDILHRNMTYVRENNATLLEWATQKMPKLLGTLLNVTADVVQSPQMRKLKQTGSFDLVVYSWFFNDFQLGLSGHFRCPSVLISPSVPAIKLLRDFVGNPTNVAYSPALFAPFGANMTFAQRLINFGLAGVELVATNLYKSYVMESYYDSLFPEKDQPRYDDVRKNVSLVLLNQHFSEGLPAPSVPGMVEVGGLTLNFNADTLDEKIREFLDSANDGAVLLNFDENINMSKVFESKKIQDLMRVFSRLPLKLVMRWESMELVANKPDNVLMVKSLVQNAVLSHRNMRLFISSCDQRSINEARFHGVPVLGLPQEHDHHLNLKPAMDEGWAFPMSFHYLDERAMHFALDIMFNNTRFADSVSTAAVFRDRQRPPLETAVWSIEYVLRYSGAKHMQSHAVHLNWFQVNSLDVIGVLLFAAWILWRILRFNIWAYCWLLRSIYKCARRERSVPVIDDSAKESEKKNK